MEAEIEDSSHRLRVHGVVLELAHLMREDPRRLYTYTSLLPPLPDVLAEGKRLQLTHLLVKIQLSS